MPDLNMVMPWPNKIVPYQLCPGHSEAQNKMIRHSLEKIESFTCVKFVERTPENYMYYPDFVEIKVMWCSKIFGYNLTVIFAIFVYLKNKNDGCYSSVGCIGGAQTLNLAGAAPRDKCFFYNCIIHEFVHG